ncbi:unnamed protein product, partial [marine sediment metagenome]
TYSLKVLSIIEVENTKDLFIFPISKNLILLLLTNNLNKEPVIKGRYKLDKADYAIEINKIIFQESYNFIYSPIPKIIKELLE